MDMAYFNRGMGQYNSGVDGMNKKTAGLKGLLGGMRKAIAGFGVAAAGVAVGAIAGLAKGLWECAQEAAEAEEAAAALDAVIKSTGRDMTKTRKMTDKYASSLQATTRFSDEQVMAAETILLQFESMNEKVFPDAIALTADEKQAILSWIHQVRAAHYASPAAPDRLKTAVIQPIPQPPKLDAKKVSLGKRLYHDTRLSKDNTISCASCHEPGHGFSSPKKRNQDDFTRTRRHSHCVIPHPELAGAERGRFSGTDDGDIVDRLEAERLRHALPFH